MQGAKAPSSSDSWPAPRRLGQPVKIPRSLHLAATSLSPVGTAIDGARSLVGFGARKVNGCEPLYCSVSLVLRMLGRLSMPLPRSR
jgi:hypothetical protein